MTDKSDNKIVLVNGCFNILHPEHVKLLAYASALGQCHVAINEDSYMKKKYGDNFTSLEDRKFLLLSLRWVDVVHTFPDETPDNIIRRIQPDIIVKGPDYLNKALPEQALIDELGIQLKFRPGTYNYSSTALAASLNLMK